MLRRHRYAEPVTNRLARSTSAYLAQHAENPVDWYEWGDEAFELARSSNRPVFLSVGYAACHWCHVMAHESFEDPTTAALMNERFVCIKVDREERPDVDSVYMAATQAVSGHGGWPMSVFLTPEGHAFMAGTYYPPIDAHGQPSFTRLLLAMSDAWNSQRDAVNEQAAAITSAIGSDTAFVNRLAPRKPIKSWRELTSELCTHLIERVDGDGGFGPAPKFPRPSYVEALIAHGDHDSHVAASLTLDAMSRRGLYDHIGGGFARYSVDAQWHVPHFEKMLSDQALLAIAYFRADRARGGATPWRNVALDTLSFVVRELAVAGGFASSLDADSAGHEGLHVTWTPEEVRLALGPLADEFFDETCARWRIETSGSFEGRSIPRLADDAPFVTPSHLAPALGALRHARAQRVQPGRDEKVILEWNAMFAVAAFESCDDTLIDVALELLQNLSLSHFSSERWWRTEAQRAHATAADIGWLIEAQLSAFETTGDDQWLTDADDLIHYLLRHYWDGPVPTASQADQGNGLFATSDDVSDIFIRPKEIFDGATPSSHAVCATAMARYALLNGDDDVMLVAERLIELAGTLLNEHPAAVPDLVRAYGFVNEGREIVVPGESNELSNLVRSFFVPCAVTITGTGNSPLLAERERGRAYVCRGRSCDLPTSDVARLREQLTQLNAVSPW
jgi:uncharacterized protein YyaL (SSP411 family)